MHAILNVRRLPQVEWIGVLPQDVVVKLIAARTLAANGSQSDLGGAGVVPG